MRLLSTCSVFLLLTICSMQAHKKGNHQPGGAAVAKAKFHDRGKVENKTSPKNTSKNNSDAAEAMKNQARGGGEAAAPATKEKKEAYPSLERMLNQAIDMAIAHPPDENPHPPKKVVKIWVEPWHDRKHYDEEEAIPPPKDLVKLANTAQSNICARDCVNNPPRNILPELLQNSEQKTSMPKQPKPNVTPAQPQVASQAPLPAPAAARIAPVPSSPTSNAPVRPQVASPMKAIVSPQATDPNKQLATEYDTEGGTGNQPKPILASVGQMQEDTMGDISGQIPTSIKEQSTKKDVAVQLVPAEVAGQRSAIYSP